ncbi:hypothetical protein H1Q63_14310 [Desmonostoc muscorum CCALA 125]|nr:hypothetical protein [Desmonostoc muscorum CCALA 125]
MSLKTAISRIKDATVSLKAAISRIKAATVSLKGSMFNLKAATVNLKASTVAILTLQPHQKLETSWMLGSLKIAMYGIEMYRILNRYKI